MRPIFGAVIGLLLVASACVAGAAYLIDEATKQVKQEAESHV